MPSVRLLVVYLVVVFVGGGLVAPWLALGVSSLADGRPWLEALADHPFCRYVHRSLLLVAVAGLWPLLRMAGMGSWAAVGLRCSTTGANRFGLGLLTAVVVVGGIGLWAMLVGARQWNPRSTGDAVAVLMRAGSAGLAVGFLEELLFRGVVLGLLLRNLRLWPALVGSSLFFAALHFLGRPPDPEELRWWSGLVMVGGMLSALTDGARLIPAGLTLTMFGMLLGLCYWRTGDLLFSMGLHAGLVFSLKLYGSMTAEVAESALWFWGSKQWTDGWLAVLAMGVLWWVSDRLTGRRQWAAAARDRGEPDLWPETTSDV